MFREYRIAQIGEVVGGGTPSTKTEEYWGGDIPWISPSDLTGYNFVYISRGENNITQAGLNKSGTRLLPKNTLLFSSRAPIGYVAIANNPVCTNQGFKSIICNESIIDPLYLYYYVKANLEYFKLWGTGATFPEISGNAMKRIKICIHNDLKQQKAISSLLYSYDNLIELNNKRIKVLEQMAENLYKEWFVRFRFPGHETAEFENGIPKGWKYCTVESLSNVCQRGISPDYDDAGELTVISQKCIRQNIMDISEARKHTKAFKPELNLVDGDTVICSTGTGTLGRVGQVYGDYPDTTFDSHVTLVRAKAGIGKHFLYWALKEMQPWFMNMGIGSTNQQELYQGTIKNAKVLKPADCLISQFDQVLEPIHSSIISWIKSQENLVRQRDLLLPRLMSGKIEIIKGV